MYRLIASYGKKKHNPLYKLRRSFTSIPHLNKGDEEKRSKLFSQRVKGFPDFIDKWTVKTFYKTGVGATLFSGSYTYLYPTSMSSWIIMSSVSFYWYIGLNDLRHKYPINESTYLNYYCIRRILIFCIVCYIYSLKRKHKLYVEIFHSLGIFVIF